jgi:hypothetical protein
MKPDTFVALVCSFSYWRMSHNCLPAVVVLTANPSTPLCSHPGHPPALLHSFNCFCCKLPSMPSHSLWPSISVICPYCPLCLWHCKCGSQDSPVHQLHPGLPCFTSNPGLALWNSMTGVQGERNKYCRWGLFGASVMYDIGWYTVWPGGDG